MANELVLVSSRSGERDSKQDTRDHLGVELEAMSTIGRTLDAIEDPALRQRILNWIVERWGGDRSLVVIADAPAHASTRHSASDPALSVDSIADLFSEGPVEARPRNAPEIHVTAPAVKAPVESMLQSLAADFQRLADEWNGDAKT